MKITLISLHSDLTAVGPRYLAACLKRDGHRVVMVFLPDPAEENRPPGEALLGAVSEAARGSGLVGLSLLSCHFERAKHLTLGLKKNIRAPVLWGGIEPTIRPEACLASADLICRGEGEGFVAELADKIAGRRPFFDMPNLGRGEDGAARLNPLRPLIQDLDGLPAPDYDTRDHFIARHDRLERLDEETLRRHMAAAPIGGLDRKIYYQVMASRGCPHKCAYCCNDFYRTLYPGGRYLRRRSPRHIVAEIQTFRERFPFVQAVAFSDDAFMIAADDEIERFSRLYGEAVGLPFRCLVSPQTISEKKMARLVACGLQRVQMGIESGSDRILSLYNRPTSREKIIGAARILNRFKNRMAPPIYDFIIENPFEGRQEIRDSLSLIADLPRPFRIQVFPLKIFPGTRLFSESLQKRPKDALEDEIYRRPWQPYERGFVNLLFVLPNTRCPVWLWKILTSRLCLDLFDNKLVNYFLIKIDHLMKGRRKSRA
jgi:radical SAM superfamily enzyme YgiQ (UPF0313 family)